MASPQLENGYTKIANELLEALCAINLSGHEWNVVHAIIRKTYGYNKKEDWVTNTQIMKLTGQSKQKVSNAKRKLLDKKIVTENGYKISLNKDYESWKELPKTVTELPKSVTKVTENGDHKRQYKDNKQKTTSKGEFVIIGHMQNLIPEVIKAMELVDPKNKTYYGNKTQRAAVEFLLEEYGVEEVMKRIEVLPQTNTMEYFPSITTPCQLRDKWVQLNNQIQRHKSKIKSADVIY